MAFNPTNIVPVKHPLFFILRVIQIVLAVILLGLLSDLAAFLGSSASVPSGAAGVGLFTVILTLALGVYYIVATTAVTKIYNAWAVLALEAAAVLFWLISFALIADTVALASLSGSSSTSFEGYCYKDSYYCWDRRSVNLRKRSGTGNPAAVVDAALAFAVIEWILFIVTLVLYSLAFHRERSTAGAEGTIETKSPGQMEAQAPEPHHEMMQPMAQPPQTQLPADEAGHQQQVLH